MRYVLGAILFTFQLTSLSGVAADKTPTPAYIAPNAQTGLLSDFVYTPVMGYINLLDGQSLLFEFNDALISELSTLRIYVNTPWGIRSWTGYTEYGQSIFDGVAAAPVVVDKTSIKIVGGAIWVYSVRISGLRCNVAQFTQSKNPPSPPTVTVKFMVGQSTAAMSKFEIATFAEQIDSHLITAPAYIWSEGFWHATATIRASEAGDFANAFETQSRGSETDATQLIVTLWGMPDGARLKNAVVAGTTSATVTAAVSTEALFPLSGSPVNIPVHILAQDPEQVENIDITLTFEIAGVAEKIPAVSVDSTVTLGPQVSNELASPVPFDPVPGAGIGGNRYSYNPSSPVSVLSTLEWPMETVQLRVDAGGAASFKTAGESRNIWVGYTPVTHNSGSNPYGTAVISFRQNEVTVSEVGVPATSPTTQTMIFVEYRSGVNAIPGRGDSGTIDVKTGIAIENSSSGTANVTYTLRDLNGGILTTGRGTIGPGIHLAKFIDQFNEIASDFNLPPDFQRTLQFGSLTVVSDRPISVLALRATTNQRNEFLLTTLPTADLTQSPGFDPVYFPHLVDGGGYTTSLILMNSSNRTESGTLQILDNNGAPLAVKQVGGKTDSAFTYSIPPGGAFYLQTDGSPTGIQSGWAKVTPNFYSPTPVGAGLFACNPGSTLVSASGIPATPSTYHARLYVDLSSGHNTGLAIANVWNTAAGITIKAYQNDGISSVGTSQGLLQLPAGGHDAKFADQFISGLPQGFKGVLDVSSPTPFAALTLRSLVNERNDFLMVTFPVADAMRTPLSPIAFPQVVDGGGYDTEFILVSGGQPSSGTLGFYGEDGAPPAPRGSGSELPLRAATLSVSVPSRPLMRCDLTMRLPDEMKTMLIDKRGNGVKDLRPQKTIKHQSPSLTD